MKKYFSPLLLLPVFFLVAPVPPLPAQSQMEMNQQSAREFDKADAELNTVYQKVVAKQDAEGRKKLQAAQRAWILYRDAEASFVADGERGGSIVPLVYNTERTELTLARVLVLRKLL